MVWVPSLALGMSALHRHDQKQKTKKPIGHGKSDAVTSKARGRKCQNSLVAQEVKNLVLSLKKKKKKKREKLGLSL